jgi:hypothetical protein
MSSPRAAAAKVARRPAAKPKSYKSKSSRASAVTASPAKGKVAPKPAPKAAPASGLSAEAIRLAAEIEREFAKRDDALSKEAMQTLMGALSRVYAVQVESGANYTPIVEGQSVSPTAVMLTASGLLRAANLAVFELGMWQSWTGR